jgi:glycyl-tRNA synthetase beta chain
MPPMSARDFLVEIGCEEIPVAYVPAALAQFTKELTRWLEESHLAHGAVRPYATARRLALLVEGLQARQDDREEEVTGPPVKAAYRDGEPTKAALGFAKGQGAELSDLHEVETPKGAYLALHKKIPGRDAAELLVEALPGLITGLRFPKTMIWGNGKLRFARPIRWIIALLDDEVLPLKLGPLSAGRTSAGRRQSGVEKIEIARASDYAESMRESGVEVDPLLRRERLLVAARVCAADLGGRLVEDEELADTVNYLSEWPVALAGSFDAATLALPRQVITTAMKSHQRYFSVESEAGELLPAFIVVLNGERPDPAMVRSGNERVLTARLADARFYWDEDRRVGLAGMRERLTSLLWVEGHGSMADRGERLRVLVGRLADLLPGGDYDREALDWAALHCKADQASEMIKDGKEFTKLSGAMGREYALAEGVDPAWADLLWQHSLPRQAGDRLPASDEGALLSLADRLDAIAGLWQAGFAPTGSKDPYALRRQAMAVLRLLLEKELPLCLGEAINAALLGYPAVVPGELRPLLLEFFLSRFEGLMEDAGVAPDVFDAVVAGGETRVLDLRARALALNALRGDPAFEKLVTGARRVGNILAKEGLSGDPLKAYPDLESWAGQGDRPYDFTVSLLEAEQERHLHDTFAEAAPLLLEAAGTRDYSAAYRRLADLGTAIDDYFDGVMVNCENEALRKNRLAFLRNLAQVFLYFADFSLVVLEGEREN